MTENEAKSILEEVKMLDDSIYQYNKDYLNALEIVIKALEEIQQYRAIGTVERFQQLVEQFKPHVTDKTSCPERHCNKCDIYRKENEKYHEIGTVEECREARERQRAKKYKVIEPCKSVTYYQCPFCDGLLHINENFCGECGQAIDWSDTD